MGTPPLWSRFLTVAVSVTGCPTLGDRGNAVISVLVGFNELGVDVGDNDNMILAPDPSPP